MFSLGIADFKGSGTVVKAGCIRDIVLQPTRHYELHLVQKFGSIHEDFLKNFNILFGIHTVVAAVAVGSSVVVAAVVAS